MPIRFSWFWTGHFTSGEILNFFCYVYIFKRVIFFFSSSVNYNYVLKCNFWGCNLNLHSRFKMHFFGEQFEEHLCSKMYFLREQFWRTLLFWNVFFEGATFVLKFMNNLFKIYVCWLVWLLLYIFMAAE